MGGDEIGIVDLIHCRKILYIRRSAIGLFNAEKAV